MSVKAQMREIVARYPNAALGHAALPAPRAGGPRATSRPRASLAVAEAIGAKPDEVESVVTFYSMYTPGAAGAHIIKVCTSISCYLRGCDDVLAHLEERLGIRRGETTTDGRFTLESAECLAACGMAPVLQVNDQLRRERDGSTPAH